MTYIYEDTGQGQALTPSSSRNLAGTENGTNALAPFANLIKMLAPVIALVLVGFLAWYILKKAGVIGKRRRSKRRAQNTPTRTLGGWDAKQADETRHRALRKLVSEDGYAKVVRRLTLTKNNNPGLRTTIDYDLDYLKEAEGRA